ncbi:FCD domain-containing protein [Rhizobium sp. S152]|uniref:FCD domain-containing protein n=1 Tax=Rhizobium sp. S152 TaxID=3055038 RepID=UPI003FA78F14
MYRLRTVIETSALRLAIERNLEGGYSLYSGRLAALRTYLASIPQRAMHSLKEHEAILVAVRSADVNAATTLLAKHIGHTSLNYETGVGAKWSPAS